MDITFYCTHCGQQLKVDGGEAGMFVPCPKCKTPLTIPASPRSAVTPPQAQPACVAAQRTSSGAIWALVLGILGLVSCGLLSIPAIIVGHISRKNIRSSQGQLKGSGMALTGLILGYAIVYLPIIAIVVVKTVGATIHNPFDDSRSNTSTQDAPSSQQKAGSLQHTAGWTMGDTVTFSDSQWRVLEAKTLGNRLAGNDIQPTKHTSGTFILVTYEVTNTTRKENAVLDTPTLVDSRQRTFNQMDEAMFYLPNGQHGMTLESLPPGVTKTFHSIYEVAGDAQTLRFQARSLGVDTEYKLINLTLVATALSPETFAKYKEWNVCYTINMGPVMTGCTFGNIVDALNAGKKDWRAGRTLDDTKVVITILSGHDEIDLHFVCNEAQRMCVVTGGYVNKQELSSIAAVGIVAALVSSTSEARTREAEKAAAAAKSKANSVAAQAALVELQRRLATAEEEEQKELEQAERQRASIQSTLQSEIQSLTSRGSEAQKTLAALNTQHGPLKEQIDYLNTGRSSIIGRWSLPIAKARTAATNAREAANKYHADYLLVAAKFINDALQQRHLSIAPVPADGRYSDKIGDDPTGTTSNVSFGNNTTTITERLVATEYEGEVFENKDAILNVEHWIVHNRPGDLLPNKDGSLQVVTQVSTKTSGNEIRFRRFVRFPKTLEDARIRQSFYIMYLRFARDLWPYDAAAKAAQSQLATTEQGQQAELLKWDSQNAITLKILQDEQSTLAKQIAELSSSLSSIKAEQSFKESILNKPKAEQIAAMRQEISTRYGEKKRLLAEQRAKLEAQLKNGSAIRTLEMLDQKQQATRK